MAETLQVREVLEEGLIRCVAGVLTDEELTRLETVVTRMDEAGRAGRPFPELDREFHELLYASLGITEFGTCTFVGAPEQGGMGWNVVDYGKEPPEIKGDLVRSERVQAAYLTDLLDVFESMNLHAAMAFEFVSPEAPHRPDNPRYDLDMAAYAIVKPLKDRPDDPNSDWHWEPKQAFHALARHYGRARC